MAIGTGDQVQKFGTSQVLVTASGGTSAVASGSFSVTADSDTWTNSDDVPLATLVMEGQFGSVSGIFLYPYFNCFLRPMNIRGTNDAPVPSTDYPHKIRCGFPVPANISASTLFSIPQEIVLPNGYTGAQYEFYIFNETGLTLAAGWQIYLRDNTLGPKA